MKNLITGIVIGFLIVGCGGLAFSYHWYGLSIASYDGKLLGVTIADDKDFKTCENNNCVVMYSSDFFALKQDYMDTKQQLSECQRSIK